MNNQRKQTRPDSEKLTLEVTPLKFESDTKSKLIMSHDLIHQVAEMFRPVMNKFAGLNISINNIGEFEIYLGFRERGKNVLPDSPDKIDIVKKINESTNTFGFNKNTMSIREMVTGINTLRKNKVYTLTDDGKDILSDFLSYNNKKSWNQLIFEQPSAISPYETIVECIIGPLSLEKILSKLYGEKEEYEDGRYSKLTYMVNPMYMVNNIYGYSSSNDNPNIMLNIQQLNTENVREMDAKLNAARGGSMYTGSGINLMF